MFNSLIIGILVGAFTWQSLLIINAPRDGSSAIPDKPRPRRVRLVPAKSTLTPMPHNAAMPPMPDPNAVSCG